MAREILKKIGKERDKLATRVGKAIKKKTEQVKKDPKKTAASVAATEAGIVAAREIVRKFPKAGILGGVGGAASLGFAAGSAIEAKTGVGKKLGNAVFEARQKIQRKKVSDIQKRRQERVTKARKKANKK